MEKELNNIYQILTNIGYSLKDYGKEYRAKPIYRESDNDTVLRIYKDTGFWVDFKENISGNFPSLIRKSLNLTSEEEAKTWLKDKNYDYSIEQIEKKPAIKNTKIFDKSLLAKLNKNNEYWIDRGISQETLSAFQGGVAEAGKMKNRYVFPIFDLKSEIVGFSGRDITNKSKIKWKHIGEKSNWRYPLFINSDILEKEKEIFLIESIGDGLKLWDAGVKNFLITFGLEISITLLNYLLRMAPNKIYIAFNNDAEKNLAGNQAAVKAERKLLRYFDKQQIKIRLPNAKDFGEMSVQQIQNWITKC